MKNVKSAIKEIKFSEQAINMFVSEIKKFDRIETGGVLIGYIQDEVAFVEKATDGGPNATHEDYYFQADPNYINMLIDMEIADTSEEFAILLILGAINFDVQKLSNQYFSIIKYKDNKDFFRLMLK